MCWIFSFFHVTGNKNLSLFAHTNTQLMFLFCSFEEVKKRANKYTFFVVSYITLQ